MNLDAPFKLRPKLFMVKKRMENVHRIEVGISTNKNLQNAIIQDLGINKVQKVEIINVYTLVGGNLDPDQLQFLGKEVFSDLIAEKFSVQYLPEIHGLMGSRI